MNALKNIKTIKDYIFIILGTLSLALGLNLFLVPIKLSTGGVSGIGTAVLHLFGVPLAVTNIMLNGILFLIGYKYLGKDSLIKTIAGILFLSLFLGLTESFKIHTDDMWISALAGGILSGTGIGLNIRRGASTGGSDFGALILNKFFPHLSVGALIMIIDCIIIICVGFIFKSIVITLYSLTTLYISCRVTDIITLVGDRAKSVYIISAKSCEISSAIMEKFKRGVTGIQGKGMYSNNNYLILLCAVSPKELPFFVGTIRNIDKNAFMIISEAQEVVGEGFKIQTPYDKIL